MPDFKAVFFDVDGVLLDSLPPHLALCRALNIQYGLGLDIPDIAAFKRIARSGVPISPMVAFFRAVGFPEEEAKRGDHEYRMHFTKRYRIPVFQGVQEMLQRLTDSGLYLGIVTANTLTNIQKPLKSAFSLFHPPCVFTHDTTEGLPKAEAIRKGAKILGITPSEILFVGDQRSDAQSATDAGAHFLGVTYGWGIAAVKMSGPTAGSPDEIAAWVTHRVRPNRTEP
ncbi:HAD family hydrolase [Desulfoluna sp.]|uniref:HAD family hydrolase n=1 Tax=Desulfoluna sp. TaxID=2045199 RepID=UPI00261DCB8F|nr:HAD family hydrolase [Desulfoluna sp.]